MPPPNGFLHFIFLFSFSFSFLTLSSSFFGFTFVLAADDNAWSSRSIYQLLTDRFAVGNSTSNAPCSNISYYCGGTFDGITDHLDYIQGMGFDAIWISPIVTNIPGGYHGYWTQNFNTINPFFGSPSSLQNLLSAAHQRGMFVMLDVVVNHVGPVGMNFSSIVPFNDPSHYHTCSQCGTSSCSISNFNCFQNEVEFCRLVNLPDLDQNNPFVNYTLLKWIASLLNTYPFDGLRIDTVPEVLPSFWSGFQSAANTFTIGEVFSDMTCCQTYQESYLDSVLNYPFVWTLRSVFQGKQSMFNIRTSLSQLDNFRNPNVLGTFLDNHDNPRFLNGTNDVILYQNALVFILLCRGMPIVYYGTEQGFSGGQDPHNREPLWTTGFNQSTPLYLLLKTLNSVRKQYSAWNLPHIERYVANNFYAFTRGPILVLVTNVGSQSHQNLSFTITYHSYPINTQLCNILAMPPSSDCVQVLSSGISINLVNGMPKVYTPVSSIHLYHNQNQKSIQSHVKSKSKLPATPHHSKNRDTREKHIHHNKEKEKHHHKSRHL